MVKSEKIIEFTNNWNKEWALHFPDNIDISKENFLIGKIKLVHYHNFSLWIKEIEVRDTNKEACEIVNIKRNIDTLNLKRASIIEEIDNYFMSSLKLSIIKDWSNLYINSQTLGKIIDRISIICLKYYHTKKRTEDKEITTNLKKHYDNNLKILDEQIIYLGMCLDKFYHQLKIGKGYMMPYYQFKMYE